MEATPPQIPVFHGTRRSLAESDREERFGHLSVAEQLQQVASRHSLALGVLEEHLATNGRSATTDERAGTVSFAPLHDKAGDLPACSNSCKNERSAVRTLG